MLRRVKEYVERYNMLEVGDRVVVGVSGGADSVCLFYVLHELKKMYGLELYVVHVNHGIRGQEADEDENFVKELCELHGIQFCSVRVDVRALAKEKGLSEEEAGRMIRYQAFYKVLEQNNCNKIAVAHNQNDQAETVLFHLFRGSGIKGLTGISPMRDQIIRPLLCVNREEIEQYLNKKQVSYQTDQTNLTDEYTRNKIRLHILPYVKKQVNFEAVEHISRSANMLREAEAYIEKNTILCFNRIVVQKNGQYFYKVEDFMKEDIVIQKMIIRHIISNLVHKLKNIEEEHVVMILSLMDKPVGKCVDLPYGIKGERGYETVMLCVKNLDENRKMKKIANTILVSQQITVSDSTKDEYYIETLDLYITFHLINNKKNLIIPKNNYTKWFDYDKIDNTIFIRSRSEGDVLQIDQQGSMKKLKSIFINNKVPRDKRDTVPLLADGKHIMWIIGDRISEAYKIDEGTKRILVVEVIGGKNNVRQNQCNDF